MSISILKPKNLLYLAGISLLLILCSEPALALNVEKIGKGLVGSDRDKMIMLKNVAFYAGLFFVILGSVIFAFKKKKFSLQKRSDTNDATGPFLIVFGCILMLAKLF